MKKNKTIIEQMQDIWNELDEKQDVPDRDIRKDKKKESEVFKKIAVLEERIKQLEEIIEDKIGVRIPKVE